MAALKQRAQLLQTQRELLLFEATFFMKSLPLLLILSSGHSLAQSPAIDAPAEVIASPTVLFDILGKGGVMMVPLAAMALITIILIILYALTIRRATVVTNRFMKTASSLLQKRDFMELLSYSHRRSEMVARLTYKTVYFLKENPQSSVDEIKEIAESEGSRQSGILAQRITWLGDIGAIAPMLGLLGTVIGMIKSFLFISAGGSPGNLTVQLSQGISEALVTTACGLVIGITAIIFHSYFKGRVNRLLHEFEAASTHVISQLVSQMKTPPAPQQAPVPAPSPEMYAAQDVVMPQGR